MSGNIIENIDFDGDLSFSGKDLDISWAYLQVKALLDSGSSDVDSYNFREKVVEQYNLNKSAGIAEPNDNGIISLPGALKLGMPKGIDQVIFDKKWTADDMFGGTNITNKRSDSDTTELLESISGEKTGTIINGYWTATKNNNKPHSQLLGLSESNGELRLDDKGSISNITSWVLHWKAKTRNWLDKKDLLVKGGDVNEYQKNSYDVKKFQLRVKYNGKPQSDGRTHNLAIITAQGVNNFFLLPGSLTWADFTNKEIDFYLVRDGQTVAFYADLNDGAGPLEFPQQIPGSLPSIINMNDLDVPMQFFGSAYESITDIWISNSDTNADSLSRIGSPAHRYMFAHDFNIENSYFDYKNFFMDKFGGFAQIYGIESGTNLASGSSTNQPHWTTEKSQDGTANGFQPRDRVLKLFKGYQYLSVVNLNFASNFTTSFWVRTSAASGIIRFKNGNNEYSINRVWNREAFDVYLNGNRKSRISVSGLTSASMSDNWNHITIVKNRNIVGFWLNGDYIGFSTITDSEMNNMGYVSVDLMGSGSSSYFANMRVLGYATSNIPANDFGKRTSYEFVDTLKENVDT